jgi:membrane protease YdiL (CAAX protease family)
MLLADRSGARRGDRIARPTIGCRRRIDSRHRAHEATGEDTRMQTLRSLVARRPLVTFFILAYALSWLGAVPYALGVFPIPIFPFGPFLAALIVAPLVGGWPALTALLQRMVQWRAGLRWYALALLLPTAVAVAVAVATVWLGAPAPSTAFLLGQAPAAVPIFAGLLLSPFSGALGEEPGWRGIALPRLLASRSPLAASLLLGALVAGWHAPLFATGLYSQVGVRVAFIVTTTVLYTLLFQGTGGSVLLAMLFHTAWNAAPEILFPAFADADLERALVLFNLFGIVVAIGAALLAWRRLTRVPAPGPTPAPALAPRGA